MTDKQVVPVAYVTKWPLTRGVMVVRSKEHHMRGGELVLSSLADDVIRLDDWTEDRAVAESRYRDALQREHARLLKCTEAVLKRMSQPVPFMEKI